MSGAGIEMGFSTQRGGRLSGAVGKSVSGWLASIEQQGGVMEVVPLWADPAIVKYDQFGNIPNTPGKPLYSEMIGVLAGVAAGRLRGATTAGIAPPGFGSLGEWSEKRFNISRRYFRVGFDGNGKPLLGFYQKGGSFRAFAGYRIRRRAPKKFGLEKIADDYLQRDAPDSIALHSRRLWSEMLHKMAGRR